MAGWNRKRAAAGTASTIAVVAVVAVAWAGFALAAPAQEQTPEPRLLPLMPGNDANPPAGGFGEDEIQPAQYVGPPATPSTGAPVPTLSTRAVPDPPTPVVRIQVRVPADAPPGDTIKYVITVQNASSAEAHAVIVRNPIPKNAVFVKTEPEKDASSTPEQLVWKFGSLAAGKSKTIELTLRPNDGAGEVKNLAYVAFEHGEVVTTKINKPTVKVTKSAPRQVVRDEPYTVRVVVENAGKVAAENVRVVENLPASAEVDPITKGARRSDNRDGQPVGQQWEWNVGRLMPGERRAIDYRVTAREAKEIFALTNLAADKGTHEKAEAKTAVLTPGLTVKLTGPNSKGAPVAPGDPAKYEITVRNAGTLPCANVRVTGTLPADCKPTKKTEGGQLTKDAIIWTVPRLAPGEAQTFRFEVKAHTTGPRVVVASVADARGQRAADEVNTLFLGTAALVWESVPNPVSLAVGRQGTFTIRVRNNGGEAARNVRVEVDLPDAVSFIQATPTVRPTGNKLVFGPESLAAGGETTITITFEARQSAQAYFVLRMTADSLGDRPMTTEKMVEITGAAR